MKNFKKYWSVYLVFSIGMLGIIALMNYILYLISNI